MTQSMNMNIFCQIVAACLTVACSASYGFATPAALPAGWGLVWSDDFTGTTLNDTKWERAPEWQRRDTQWWSDQDAYLDGTGNLVLQMRRDGDTIQAGAVRTRKVWPDDILFEQTYGYFEIRTTFPVIPHGWGAFWLMPSNANPYTVTNGSDGSEVDIFETIHSTQGWINHAVYWGSYGSSHDVSYMPDLYDGNYHTVGLLWTEDEYVFYVDDVETWRTTAGDGVMQVPAYLKITMEAFPGAYDHLDDPIAMHIDYVRVYNIPEPGTSVLLLSGIGLLGLLSNGRRSRRTPPRAGAEACPAMRRIEMGVGSPMTNMADGGCRGSVTSR